MRIGVDATYWLHQRGFGRFTREILTSLAVECGEHQFVWVLDRRDAPRVTPPRPNVTLSEVELGVRPLEALSHPGRRSLRDMLRMTRAVRSEHLDVFLCPTVQSYFPLPRGLPAVIGIHDTIIERYPWASLPSRQARLLWRLKIRAALWQARIVLTVSDFAAREIEASLNVPPARIRVVHEAPAAAYRPGAGTGEIREALEAVGLPGDGRYFIYVGGWEAHKNVEGLVRAHARLAAELREPAYLLLVGDVEKDFSQAGLRSIRSEIQAAGVGALVRWADFVPDEGLRLLHSGALALVLPSWCEGFGLPAVEAAACGTPVIATTRSPLPRLLQGAGIFVEPSDDDGLVQAMRSVATDASLRAAMAGRAVQCAARLSWASAARQVLGLLQEASAMRRFNPPRRESRRSAAGAPISHG